ncbi:MAG: signal peptidase I [Chloroflexi bacterium]|nr:signal peptidase I [Chloroflexota bacterium]
MAVFKRFSPNLASAFWVVLMIVTWLAFAPTQAGGMASYIIVVGNSMEPGFHIGDLVITHKETNYQIGEAVVYRNLELGNFVFHRIISEDMGRFTLQGDNNSWIDTYQPSREEIIGRLWLHIPKGGVYVQKMRAPLAMAMAAGALGGFLAIGMIRGKSRGNKHMANPSIQGQFASFRQKMQNWFTPTNKSESGQLSDTFQGNMLEGSFFALGVLALISLIFGIISFSRPASRIVKEDFPFEHVGFFSYSASGPQDVYDSSAIKSGDPIFPRLTCSIDVNFQYTFIAQNIGALKGTHQLTATIVEPVSGWQRSVPLQNETAFSGNAFGSSAKLNLCQMEKLAQSMEEGTDFHPGSYILTISPNIKLTGDISGRLLDSSFNPSLTFNYDRVHFYLAHGEEQENPLNPTETGALSEERQEVNTVLLFGTEFAVPALRWFAVIGLVGSLAGGAFLGMRLQHLSRNDQDKYIRMKYGSMVIDAHTVDTVNLSGLVDVTTVDDLAKLAEKFNTMILHTENSDSHTYYVRGDGIVYRFVIPAETGSTIPAKEAMI